MARGDVVVQVVMVVGASLAAAAGVRSSSGETPVAAPCGGVLELLDQPCGPGLPGLVGVDAIASDGTACAFDLCSNLVGRWRADGSVEWHEAPLPLAITRGVNSAGQIIATSLVAETPTDMLLSDDSWSMLDEPPGAIALPPEALIGSAKAVDLNDAGVAVGWWSVALPFLPAEARVCMWTAEGFVDLGDVFELPNQYAAAISNSGAIVGNVAPFKGPPLAYIYGPQYGLQPFELGTGGAVGVSDNDIVVGTEGLQPWIWIDGVRTSLPIPAGAVLDSIESVNSSAIAVGSLVESPGEAPRAVAWIPTAGGWEVTWLEDLVALPQGVILSEARDVSDGGAIVGIAQQSGGGSAAYRLTLQFAPAADLDGDCTVGSGDLGILLAAWGACFRCAADIDGSGVVDGQDLGMLLSVWPGQ